MGSDISIMGGEKGSGRGGRSSTERASRLRFKREKTSTKFGEVGERWRVENSGDQHGVVRTKSTKNSSHEVSIRNRLIDGT